MKRKWVRLLGGKCERCGYYKCLFTLEFHHINPEEKETEGEWRNKTFQQKIEEGKIELLCANCHREEHSECVDVFHKKFIRND